jgi:hypothetical protein
MPERTSAAGWRDMYMNLASGIKDFIAGAKNVILADV